jgi:hypothetical protein
VTKQRTADGQSGAQTEKSWLTADVRRRSATGRKRLVQEHVQNKKQSEMAGRSAEHRPPSQRSLMTRNRFENLDDEEEQDNQDNSAGEWTPPVTTATSFMAAEVTVDTLAEAGKGGQQTQQAMVPKMTYETHNELQGVVNAPDKIADAPATAPGKDTASVHENEIQQDSTTEIVTGLEEGRRRRRRCQPTSAMIINLEKREAILEAERVQAEEAKYWKEREKETYGYSVILQGDRDYNQQNKTDQQEIEKEMETLMRVESNSVLPLLTTRTILVCCVPIMRSRKEFRRHMEGMAEELSLDIDWTKTFLPYSYSGEGVNKLSETTAVLWLAKPVTGGGSLGHQQEEGGLLSAVGLYTAKDRDNGPSLDRATYVTLLIPEEEAKHQETITTSATRLYQTHKLARNTIGFIRFCGTSISEIEFKLNLARKNYSLFHHLRGEEIKHPILLHIVRIRLPKTWGLRGAVDSEICIQMDVSAQLQPALLTQLQRYMGIDGSRDSNRSFRRTSYSGFVLHTARTLESILRDPRTVKPLFPQVSSICGLDADVTRRDIGIELANHKMLDQVTAILLRNVDSRQRGTDLLEVEALVVWKQRCPPRGILPVLSRLKAAHCLETDHAQYLLDGVLSAYNLLKEVPDLADAAVMDSLSMTPGSSISSLTGTAASAQETGSGQEADADTLLDSDGRMLSTLTEQTKTDRAGLCSPQDVNGYSLTMDTTLDGKRKWVAEFCRGWSMLTQGYGEKTTPTQTDGRQHPASYKLGMIWNKAVTELGCTFRPADGSMPQRYCTACCTVQLTAANRRVQLGLQTLEHLLLRTTKDISLWRQRGMVFRLAGEYNTIEEIKAGIQKRVWILQAGQTYWIANETSTDKTRAAMMELLTGTNLEVHDNE